MAKAKRNYEIYIILDGNSEDPVIEDIITKYESWLKKNEAEINIIDKIGRRRLAYAIKRIQNGYYICFEVLAPAEIIAKLERAFKLDDNVIRHLTVLMSKQELRDKNEHIKKRAAIIAKVEADAKEKEAIALSESVQVENKDKTEA
ncbi:MAG: 30S ribosomal protein S6 [Ignavibacteriae bacterium]|jgi:small subunit ribosomal protein S6|nr:30S ribosomal protein S6 [Ignavibacteriota bacterium]